MRFGKNPEHKMTAWDAGQDLIACFDLLSEKDAELHRNGFCHQAVVLRLAKWNIAEEFNRLGSHEFELPTDAPKQSEESE